MKQSSQASRSVRLATAVLLVLMIFVCAGSLAAAQKKSSAVSPDTSAGVKASDDLLATWKTEAKGIAADLGLSKEQRGKLTDVFIAARKSQRDAVRALPEEADRVKSRAAIEAVNLKERAALAKAVKGILTDEQAVKALPLLGSFNHRWDSMVKTLSELKLEKEKMNASLKLVGSFVTAYDKARQEAAASGSRFSSSVTKDLKAKLDAGMAAQLTPEQLKTWNEATAGGKAPATGTGESKKGGKAKTKEASKD
jgi:Spy/CpxP family protein refolding chaperone